MNNQMADGIAQISQWLPVIGAACIGFALIGIAFGIIGWYLKKED